MDSFQQKYTSSSAYSFLCFLDASHTDIGDLEHMSIGFTRWQCKIRRNLQSFEFLTPSAAADRMAPFIDKLIFAA